MLERGVPVAHSTINRGVVTYSPWLEKAVPPAQAPGVGEGAHGRAYFQVKGQWYSLYRAVDKTGQTSDFLLTEQREAPAAKRFLIKAIRRHGVPEKITIAGSAANEAAIKSYNEAHGTAITIHKRKVGK